MLNTLRRALRLVDPPDPARPEHLAPLELRQGAPWTAHEVEAAASLLGWPLPEEYRLLLCRYGPLEIKNTTDIPVLEFLTPARALEHRGPLAAYLESAADDPEVIPHESLLPVVWDHDSNGLSGWAFYRRGSDVLYQCHEKYGFETDDTTLEEYLIRFVCNFAGWDPKHGRWFFE